MDHHSFGEIAGRALEGLTDSPPSFEKLPTAKRPILPPVTEDECRELRAWADTQSNFIPSATTSELAKHLEFLAATLPSKNIDEDSAKMRFSVYHSMLDGYSNAALAYMSRKVCEQYDWFPTPHQCLEILRGYRAPVSQKDLALSYCAQFWQVRLENFLDTLKAGTCVQEMVDGVSERWRRIAVEQGYLRRMPDGSDIVRSAQSLPTPEEPSNAQ